eukprot:c12288_g1_i1 orf=48-1733(+)
MEESLSHLSLQSHTDAAPLASDDASKQRKRKKKKNKSKVSSSLSVLGSTTTPLPSQKCLEARFPWKVVIRPRRGRCAVATRDIKAGELIIAEQALAFVLRSTYRTAACHACCRDLSETSPGIQCQDCNYALFCEDCRQVTSESHRECCPVLRKIGDIAEQTDCDGDLLRLAFLLGLQRSLLILESNQVPCDCSLGEIKGDVLHPSFQDAMGLQTHRDKVSASWKSSLKKGCEMLVNQASNYITNFQSSAEDMEYLAALINANAHGMGAQGLHNTDIAIGIFPFVSMLNHSCRPNCCFFSDGNVMYVRATQDISKDKELCLSYINLYEARATRRDQLAATKHFECACIRCTEPLSFSVDRFLEGVLCNIKGCGGVVVKKSQELTSVPADQPLALWQCDTCSGVFDPALSSCQVRPLAERPWDLLDQAHERLYAAISVYKERHFKEARKLLESFLSEFTGKLHPLHVLLFDALTPLMNCYRVLGDAEGGSKVCRIIINCLEKVLNGPSLELANFYFCLGEMYSECANSEDLSPILAKRYKKQAQETFNQVRQLRKICLGKQIL